MEVWQVRVGTAFNEVWAARSIRPLGSLGPEPWQRVYLQGTVFEPWQRISSPGPIYASHILINTAP